MSLFHAPIIFSLNDVNNPPLIPKLSIVFWWWFKNNLLYLTVSRPFILLSTVCLCKNQNNMTMSIVSKVCVKTLRFCKKFSRDKSNVYKFNTSAFAPFSFTVSLFMQRANFFSDFYVQYILSKYPHTHTHTKKLALCVNDANLTFLHNKMYITIN